MRGRLLAGLCLSAMLGLAPCVRAAEPVTVSVNVFGRLVGYQLPEGFVPAFENTQDGHYIHENVRRGQTVDNWDEMITLTGEEGLAEGAERTPVWFAERFAQSYAKACPNTFAAVRVDESTAGGYPLFAAYFSCGTVVSAPEPRSESVLVLFIKAGNEFYTLQWAERGEARDAAVAWDEKAWSGRIASLFPVSLCPKADGTAC